MNSCDALYSKYISERKGLSSIWRPNGFVFFKVIAGQECFIDEFFVEESDRKGGIGREMLVEIERIAAEAMCPIVTANIHLKDPGCNSTLMAAMTCGFKVVASADFVILISKKLEGA